MMKAKSETEICAAETCIKEVLGPSSSQSGMHLSRALAACPSLYILLTL